MPPRVDGRAPLRFVSGTLAAAPTVPLRRSPDLDAATSTEARTRTPRIVASVLAVLGGAAAVVVLYVVAVLDRTGRAADESAMRAAMRLGADVRGELLSLLDLVAVPTVALAVVVLAGLALARGRGSTAVAVVAIVLGAQLVTQVVKASLVRPGSDDVNSLPSGHVTLVASLGVALVLVVPRLLRPLASTAALAVTAIAGAATMIVGWHRPSDVLAAIAVVVAVTGAVALAGAVGAGTLRPGRARPRSA